MEWCNDLLLGVDEIDRQHKAIFDLLNQLSRVCHAEAGDVVIIGLLDFLEQQVRIHIETEERLMIEHSYPGIDEECRQHWEFAREAAEIRRRIKTEGPSRLLAALIAGQMAKWVVEHIRGHDRQLTDFVRGRIAREPC